MNRSMILLSSTARATKKADDNDDDSTLELFCGASDNNTVEAKLLAPRAGEEKRSGRRDLKIHD